MSAAHDDLQPVFDRSFWWFSVSFLFLMFALLIGPRLPDDQQATQCVVNVHLPGPFGIGLNCDSPEFMRLAHEPSFSNLAAALGGATCVVCAALVIFARGLRRYESGNQIGAR